VKDRLAGRRLDDSESSNLVIDTPSARLGEMLDVVVIKNLPYGVLARTSTGVQGRVHVTELRKLQGGRRVDDIGTVAPVGTKLRVRVAKVEGDKTDFDLLVN
jgi:polyribonucleotide nucleotidyltransferase